MKFSSALLLSVGMAATTTIAAPLAGQSETLSKRQPHGVVFIDDQNYKQISYSGSGWYHETEGCSKTQMLYDGTQSFSDAADASYTVQNFNSFGPNIQIYGGKKRDRGSFDVYFGGEYIGSGNAYGYQLETAGPPQVLFEWQSNNEVSGDPVFEIKNSAEGVYLFLDYVVQTY